MASLKERLADLRARLPWLDHLLTMLAHYGKVNGGGQAGAVTYFGFLSVFPILTLAAVAIGVIARVYPDIRAQMTTEISSFLPGLIGTGAGKIDIDALGGSAGGLAALIGLLAVLYSGLGWLSGLRAALEVMFVVPKRDQPNFVFGKLRDLLTLLLIGLTLMVSVVLSGAVTSFSGQLLKVVGISESALVPAVLLSVLGHVLAIAASTVLLLAMFKLLAGESQVPRSALVRGALLGGVGFEILKAVANLLIAQAKGNAAFATFGVALILLVWINYFSRLVMYSAAWAYTSPAALQQRRAEAMRAPGAALSLDAPVEVSGPVGQAGGEAAERPRTVVVAAVAAALGGLVAWLVRGGRS